MKKDKKIIIKEGRLSGAFKDSMVEFLCREIISLKHDLSKGQIRRIFSHGYQALRGKQGEDIIETAKLISSYPANVHVAKTQVIKEIQKTLKGVKNDPKRKRRNNRSVFQSSTHID